MAAFFSIAAYIMLINNRSEKRDELIYSQIVNNLDTLGECKRKIDRDYFRNAKWITESLYYKFSDNAGMTEYPIPRLEYHINYRLERINWPDNGLFKPGICDGENCTKVTVSCSFYISGGDIDVEVETFSKFPGVSE